MGCVTKREHQKQFDTLRKKKYLKERIDKKRKRKERKSES